MGVFFSKKLNNTNSICTKVNILPSSYSYLIKNIPNVKFSSKNADITIQIHRKNDREYSISAKSYNNDDELTQQICSNLKSNIINLYLIKNKMSVPIVKINKTTSSDQQRFNNTLPVLLLIAYIIFILVGVMSFIAISTEKISKMLMIISSKVSIKKVIYSKVMSILVFISLLCICSILTIMILNSCKIISIYNIVHAINMKYCMILEYIILVILGILQTIFIYGIFAMLVKDSSELHTGMMVPTVLELLAWFITFTTVNYSKFTISHWIYIVPLANILFNIKNVVLNNQVRMLSAIFTTLILFLLFNSLICKVLKIKNETKLLNG